MTSRQNNATDPVNATLNVGFLEGEIRRTIYTVGLGPSVEYRHEFSDYQMKQSFEKCVCTQHSSV